MARIIEQRRQIRLDGPDMERLRQGKVLAVGDDLAIGYNTDGSEDDLVDQPRVPLKVPEDPRDESVAGLVRRVIQLEADVERLKHCPAVESDAS